MHRSFYEGRIILPTPLVLFWRTPVKVLEKDIWVAVICGRKTLAIFVVVPSPNLIRARRPL